MAKTKNLFLMASLRPYNKPVPVLDAHTHIFPEEIIRKREHIASIDPGFALLYCDSRARMATAGDLHRYMDNEGVDEAVIVSFPFEDSGLIRLCNDYLIETAREDGRLLPLIAVDRKDEEAAIGEIERCAQSGARGVGEVSYYERGFSERERMSLEGLARFLEEQSMVLMVHVNEQVGHAYPGKCYVDFPSLARFVQGHPGLKIILAHMGGGLCFYEFMPEIKAAFSRVYYDLAAIPFLYSHDLTAFAARFLPHKVLFGSDYPLLSLARYAPFFNSLDGESRNNILWENGRHLFAT
jgi:uncharacterized protein